MSTTPSKLNASGLLLGCIIFGLGSLIVAHVNLGGWAMSFWRLAVAGVLFAILAVITKQRLPRSRAAIGYGILAGVFLGLDLALWHESIYAVGPGISTLLNSLQIFFLALIGFVWFSERQTVLQLVGLCLALLGVVLIGSPEFGHNIHAAWGFVTGIVSGAMLAASMTFIKKTHDAEPTPIFALMGLVSVGGVLAMIVPMLLIDGGHILPSTWSEVMWILIYGAVMQCIAWGLIAYFIPRLSLAVTGLLLLSEPVAALIIDYTWLDKPITGMQWLGAVMTMTAIYLGTMKPKQRALRRYRFFARFYKRSSEQAD
ncbi:DMT family transporter [Psychrobacter aestuarii]|uniref:DMT family transporter n=1 Tax=Psychrobacter aestuarii TaxID=556327 RepID=A0ABN0VWP0_9GAMM|nr:DMT family transporter [Psychrobacter aestuarii]